MEAAAVGSYAASGGNAIVSDVASFTTTLSRPEMLTLNFQSGVNQRTLVFGSIHQATWSKSQINAASGASTEISTAFTDTTSYSIGLGRKINDNFSVSASFKSEEGSGATGTSYFTLSNGSQGISLGGSYTMDNTEFRAGYNYTQIGGVTISDALGQVALYPTNSISAFGVSATIKF
jgi:long-subunit fatty acid transport protein